MPINSIQCTFAALGDRLECDECKKMLRERIREVVINWINVKVCGLTSFRNYIASEIVNAENDIGVEFVSNVCKRPLAGRFLHGTTTRFGAIFLYLLFWVF